MLAKILHVSSQVAPVVDSDISTPVVAAVNHDEAKINRAQRKAKTSSKVRGKKHVNVGNVDEQKNHVNQPPLALPLVSSDEARIRRAERRMKRLHKNTHVGNSLPTPKVSVTDCCQSTLLTKHSQVQKFVHLTFNNEFQSLDYLSHDDMQSNDQSNNGFPWTVAKGQGTFTPISSVICREIWSQEAEILNRYRRAYAQPWVDFVSGSRKMNLNNVKVPKMPGGGALHALLKLGVIAGLGVYGIANSLYTVDGGHRAIVFNRIKGIKDEVYHEGTHFMVPWFERPIIHDVRARPH
ncbi:Prohibitin [Corchorus capsularis]|uniref:Prohibitin n=1 Tax=Corchorus capsularis TaxID=210143 RepID=A0A1R3HRU4_COCAP|nr:Prohibitin [Corchorus capsularis]